MQQGLIEGLNLTALECVIPSCVWCFGLLRVIITAFSYISASRSAEDLGERVSEQLFCARPVFGLDEDAPNEVFGLLGDVRRQHGVRGLGGYFKDGGHGFVFGPRRLLGQHLYYGAAETP